MILGIALSFFFTVLSAIYDGVKINNGHYIKNHTPRWIFRFIVFCTFSIHSWEYALAAGLMFTAFFDQALNCVRKLPFWYLGTVAKWDIFFSNKKQLYIVIKIICYQSSILLFYYG